VNKYAAYVDDRWMFDLHADSEADALKLSRDRDPCITRVELVAVAR
jgi:hypothetical protein